MIDTTKIDKNTLIEIGHFLKKYNYSQKLKKHEVELQLEFIEKGLKYSLKLLNTNKKLAFEGIKELEARFKEESSFLFGVNINTISEYTFHLKKIDGILKAA